MPSPKAVSLYVSLVNNLAGCMEVQSASGIVVRLAEISDQLDRGDNPDELFERCKDLHLDVQIAIANEQRDPRFSQSPLYAERWPLPEPGFETRGVGTNLFSDR